MLLLLGIVLPYLAFAVFAGGLAWRVGAWLRRPVPVSLTLSPGVSGTGMRLIDMARELALFRSIWASDRRLWFSAWPMHASLVVILAGHVAGIATAGEQFCLLGVSPRTSRLLSHGLGDLAGLIFAVTLAALWLRRLAIPELRRLSDPADHFALALLAGIAASGMLLRFPAVGLDLAAVQAYLAGLVTFRPGPIPPNGVFLLHFTLVILLLVYFPFSKLLHGIGGVVNRAMLTQSPPAYPTPPGFAPEGRFLKL